MRLQGRQARRAAGVGALWVVVVVLWAFGVLRAGASVVFLLVAAAVAAFVAEACRSVTSRTDPWRSARRVIILVLLVIVPVGFDPRTVDAFNLTKLTLLIVGALALGWVWVAQAVWERRCPCRTRRVHWPVLVLVGWAAASTATSVNVRLSVLGAYGSYDGLVAMVAFAWILFAVNEAFELEDVKVALGVLFYGAATLVVLYGIIQLHDRLWVGPRWDWVSWGGGSFIADSIWSTFGNPNHLSGFLAIVLPMGIVLAMLDNRTSTRILAAGVSACLVIEMLQTTTRGAWLATLAAALVLGFFTAPELLRRSRRSLAFGAVVVATVLGLGVVLGSTGHLRVQLATVVDFGGKSTAGQRVELWKAAARMAGDHPLLGVGPDAYRVVFPAYQSRTFARRFGPNEIANGPHNTFLNYLSAEGFPALVAFVAVLALAAAESAGAWRRLRRVEIAGPGIASAGAPEARLVLGAVVAGLVAYVVQASFNVQQIALSFVWWVLLGLLGSLVWATRSVSFPAVGPRRTRAGSRSGANRRRRPGGQAIRSASLTTTAAAVACMVGAIALASRPWRADYAYRAALDDLGRAHQAQGTPDADRLLARSTQEIDRALRLNPWEPTYQAIYAKAVATAFRFDEARERYRRAIALSPRDANLLYRYAEVLLRIAELNDGDPTAKAAALDALDRARRANPYDPSITAAIRRAGGR